MSEPLKLTLKDFFCSYLYASADGYQHLSKTDQTITTIAKYTISILSLGFLPLVCQKIWGQDSKIRIKQLSLDLKKHHYFDLISSKDPETIRLSKKSSCDRILNGLFLGSSKGFVEATALEITVVDNATPIMKQFNNVNDFSAVITMCPNESIQGDYLELDFEEVAQDFAKRKVAWLRPGSDLFDEPQADLDLAFNATVPDSYLILKSLAGQERVEVEGRSKIKRSLIRNIPVENWFQAMFKEMDKAVLGQGNVLVHCQAGMSRSATLVAAYLIDRFDLTTKTAINFLQHKRACIQPKFVSFLKDYECSLRLAKAGATLS